MGSVAAIVFVVVTVSLIVSGIRRSRGIVARRGLSVGADLGSLSDRPRVRVREVASAGPDRVRVVFEPEQGRVDGAELASPSDLAFVVSLREDEFGFGLLHQWQESGSLIAFVMPPGSRLVRLRSIDTLQHLTLSRVIEG